MDTEDRILNDVKRVDDSIFMLAFDHETEWEALVCPGRSPTDEDRGLIRRGKGVVFRGVNEAIRRGLGRPNVAVLIDELYGSAVADEARELGIAFSMPVEPPGREFVFRFEDWQEHLKRYQPTWAKSLLWYNVEGDKEKNSRQVRRAKELADWLHGNGQKLLMELLVVPEAQQLKAVGGSLDRYESEVLPRLIAAAMQEVVDGGIVPDLWKIEGVPTREGSALVGQKALTIGGHARCLVLGRAADTETVASWLTLAGTTPGYQGFAVGRTIWHEPVVAWLRNHDDDALVAQIAERYLALVAAFRS